MDDKAKAVALTLIPMLIRKRLEGVSREVCKDTLDEAARSTIERLGGGDMMREESFWALMSKAHEMALKAAFDSPIIDLRRSR